MSTEKFAWALSGLLLAVVILLGDRMSALEERLEKAEEAAAAQLESQQDWNYTAGYEGRI